MLYFLLKGMCVQCTVKRHQSYSETLVCKNHHNTQATWGWPLQIIPTFQRSSLMQVTAKTGQVSKETFCKTKPHPPFPEGFNTFETKVDQAVKLNQLACLNWQVGLHFLLIFFPWYFILSGHCWSPCTHQHPILQLILPFGIFCQQAWPLFNCIFICMSRCL